MRKQSDKGSVSVEASLSLSFFVFFMASLICLINVCRIQTKIGNAMHLAALDISHMSYIYQLTGMYDMDVTIQEEGEKAGEVLKQKALNVDSLLNNTENMLQIIGNGGSTIIEVSENKKNISQAMDDFTALKESGISEAEALKMNGKQVMEDMKGIATDPIGFAKTLVRYGIGSGAGAAKNLIAGFFTEALLRDQLMRESSAYSSGDFDPNAYLKSMGVVGGLDGMSFMASGIFTGEDHADINLVAMYKVKVFPFLKGINIPFAQSASTRAWLSGDMVTTLNLPDTGREESEDDKTNSLWNKPDLERQKELHEQLTQEYEQSGSFVKGRYNSGYLGFDTKSNTLYSGKTIDIYAGSYTDAAGNVEVNKLPWKNHLQQKLDSRDGFNKAEGGTFLLPEEGSINFAYVIQVPENISAKDLTALQKDAEAWIAGNRGSYPQHISSVAITIQKVGGNSNYKK